MWWKYKLTDQQKQAIDGHLQAGEGPERAAVLEAQKADSVSRKLDVFSLGLAYARKQRRELFGEGV